MFPKRQCGKRSNIFMCGIIGFTGKTNAVPLLLDGLSALEYRGYDSAGIAVFGKNGDLEVYKSKGRLAVVAEKIASLPEPLVSNCGIGHTRWATHGEPSDINAHPHGTENVYIVHNGIIENYAEIKKTLTENGYSFVSETDTEVAAKLLDMNYLETRDPLKALKKTISELRTRRYFQGLSRRNIRVAQGQSAYSCSIGRRKLHCLRHSGCSQAHKKILSHI